MGAGGGALARVTGLDPGRGETRHMLPVFPGSGRKFLFVAGSDRPGGNLLYSADPASGERRAIVPVESGVAWAGGYLIHLRNRALVAQAFDASRMQVTGPEVPLAGGIASRPASGANVQVADFSAAANVIAYVSMSDPGAVSLIRNWTAFLR